MANVNNDRFARGGLALLLIDLMNDLDFPGGDQLLSQALPVAERILRLRERATRAGIPVVYVNDNFGRWRDQFKEVIAHCQRPASRGRGLVERLLPRDEDYFVLKPRHSGFYATTLEVVLDHLGARTLILTGLTGDICVLFTANDAYMRGFQLLVPNDCVASVDPAENRHALAYMQRVLKVDTQPSSEASELLPEAGSHDRG